MVATGPIQTMLTLMAYVSIIQDVMDASLWRLHNYL